MGLNLFRFSFFSLCMSAIFGFSGCLLEPENVTIAADAPIEVERGESFEIKASVTNTAPKTQKLVALDIAHEYLEGVAILSSEPDYSSTMDVPIDNTTSYVFDLDLSPGESATVVFQARALHSGDFRGDIDFCINSEYDFISKSIRTVVR